MKNTIFIKTFKKLFAICLLSIGLFSNIYLIAQTTSSPIPTSSAPNGFPMCPFMNCENYSFDLQLITADELTAAGLKANAVITKIAYDVNSGASGLPNLSNQLIYIQNTTTTSLVSAYPSPAPASGIPWNEVFSGSINFKSTGWKTITFTNPFTWDGTSSIEIDLENHQGSNAGYTPINTQFWFNCYLNYYTGSPGPSSVRWVYGFNGGSFATAETEVSTGSYQNMAFLTELTYTNPSCTPVTATTPTGTSTVCSPTGTTFTETVAEQTGLSYQWQSGSVNISGAISNTYTILNSTGLNGNQYRCVVSNSCSSSTSGAITLSVSPASSVGTATAISPTICSGSSTNINLTGYTGTMQWQQSPNGTTGWTNVTGGSGGTTSSYTTPTLSSTTYYMAVVTSGACTSAISNTATVTVSQASSGGTATATSPAICSGGNTAINLTGYTGSIQWQQSADGITGWTNVTGGSGGTSSSYTTPALTSSTWYRAEVISGACSPANSNISPVSVNTPPIVAISPGDTAQCEGTNITFISNATGTMPFSYQWYKGNNELGIRNYEFTINNLSISDTGSYYCIVSNTCSTVTSNTALLKVNASPLITFMTAPEVKCPRDSVMFKTITANQQPFISYQWFKNGSNIPEATNSSYILSVLIQENDGTYSCLVSNICGNTSSSTTLMVNTTAFIPDTIPDQAICSGDSVTFTIHPTGTNLSYQWTEGGNSIPGATRSQFSILNSELSDSNIYSCNVGNSCGSKSLNPFLLTINQKPGINIMPVTINKNAGDSVSLLLAPSGTLPFSFQWMKDNNNIVGDTQNPLNIKSIICSDSGNYSVAIINACGNIFTQVATLVINNCSGDTISGKVNYDNAANTPMTNTVVYLENSESQKLDSSTTDNTGAYKFYKVANGSYNLVCGSTTMKWGGGNPVDALTVNRYFVGLLKSFGDALMKEAADVNKDGKINPIDALLIERRYVGLIKQFTIPDWLYDLPSVIINNNSVNQDIHANCAGDVNASYPH